MLVAGPVEHRGRTPAVDLERLADEVAVEVHRQLSLQPLLEQVLEVERAGGTSPGDVSEVSLGLLDDLLPFRVQVEAELLVEFLGELLGVHLVVLVLAALLAGVTLLVAVAGLWLGLADGVALPRRPRPGRRRPCHAGRRRTRGGRRS